MASTSSLKPLQQTQKFHLSSFTRCKYSTSLIPFNFLICPPTITALSSIPHPLNHFLSSSLQVRASHLAHLDAYTHQEPSRNRENFKTADENRSGLSSFRCKNASFGETSFGNNNIKAGDANGKVVVEDRYERSGLNPRSRRKMGSGFSSVGSKNEKEEACIRENDEKKRETEVEKGAKKSEKSRVDEPGMKLRVGLDMCSKRGDVLGAIRLYDLARREGIKMGQYHYAVLLYLCSSAATGFVQPAKSGSGGPNRSLNPGIGSTKDTPNVAFQEANAFRRTRDRHVSANESDADAEDLDANGFVAGAEYNLNDSKNDSQIDFTNRFLGASDCESVNEMILLMKSKDKPLYTKDAGREQEGGEIKVSEDVKMYALKRGIEIYERMRLEKVLVNEATFTSVARMAMSLGDGDMAFDIVKQMKEWGIKPRLRSYGPALSAFCNNQDVEKAFAVEQHMLKQGIYPEEPELEALLRVSLEVGRNDKIYYLLHKLRTSVRQISPSTADLIETWFRSKLASRVGKRKWDQKLVEEAMENGGGGWHGQGWLGKGKWTVLRTSVQSDGLCKSCGVKLVTIDLDPTETEKFARSVASITTQRERSSSFQKFQKWLDYYGPFEAVVDAANVGLYNQRKFKPSKVNAVVNAIRQILPAKKWPLIVLHNRRIVGDKMEEPFNQAIMEKWKNADALYATPTGSNDDWYWLYAAIKCRCLIVTNDEMRDHLFQLLGNDFFPKWKERHQVRFSFSETGPVLHMPPPCSVVIQESEKGHWHIPIVSDSEAHGERTWLCITRAGRDSSNKHEDMLLPYNKEKQRKMATEVKSQVKLQSRSLYKLGAGKQASQETYKNLKNILCASLLSESRSILSELKAAEELGNCTIDFQI